MTYPHYLADMLRNGAGVGLFTASHGAFNNLELQAQGLMDEHGEIIQRMTISFANDQDPTFVDRPEFGVTGFDIISITLPNGNQACVLQILTKDRAPTPVARRQQASNLAGAVLPRSHAFAGIDPSGIHHHPYGAMHPPYGAPTQPHQPPAPPGSYHGAPFAAAGFASPNAGFASPSAPPSGGRAPYGHPAPAHSQTGRPMSYAPAPSPYQTPAVAHAGPTIGVPQAAQAHFPGPTPNVARAAIGVHTPPRPSSRTAMVPTHVQYEPVDDRSRSRDGSLDDVSAMMQNMVFVAHETVPHTPPAGAPPALNDSHETYETAQYSGGQGPHIVDTAESEEDQRTRHA